jgi:transcription antitermination factor NusG
VRVSPQRRFEVTGVECIVRYVSFGGKPAVVPVATVDSLRKMSGSDALEVDDDPFLRIGMPVVICEGPFTGIKGYLVKKNGRSRLQVRVETLRRSVSVEIPSSAAIPLTDAENENIETLR